MSTPRRIVVDIAESEFDEIINNKNLVFSENKLEASKAKAEGSNENILNSWNNCSQETKDDAARIKVYGHKQYYDHYGNENKKHLEESIHIPDDNEYKEEDKAKIKKIAEDSALDCTNRVVIQPSPFVQGTGAGNPPTPIKNLMQGTVVSACFRKYKDPTRPGGETFIKEWCKPPQTEPYQLREDCHEKLREQIYQSACLYFAALDRNNCNICTVPDVGCGAYLQHKNEKTGKIQGLDDKSKDAAQEIIRLAWRKAAIDIAEKDGFKHLKHIFFTSPRPAEKLNKTENINIVECHREGGAPEDTLDNVLLADALRIKFPDQKVAVTIAGGAQGLGGDFLTPGLGSQEEYAYRTFNKNGLINLSGALLQKGEQKIEACEFIDVEELQFKPDSTLKKTSTIESTPSSTNTANVSTQISIDKVKTFLTDKDWALQENSPQKFTASSNTNSSETFTIDLTLKTFTTESKDLNTFEIMLASFRAGNPKGVLPKVQAPDDATAQLWKNACVKIYGAEESNKIKIIDESKPVSEDKATNQSTNTNRPK